MAELKKEGTMEPKEGNVWALFSVFDSLAGPKVFMSHPPIDESVGMSVAELLDIRHDKGFFIHSFGEYSAINFPFRIDSPLARGGEDMLLVSFVFDFFCKQPQVVRDLMQEFIAAVQQIENVYVLFPPDAEIDADYERKVNDVALLLEELYKTGKERLESSFIGKMLMVGLDKAGKTSITRVLRDPEGFSPTQRPTLGVNIVKTVMNEMEFSIYDVGGQKQFRKRWFSTVAEPSAVIYVHDISESDENRIEESRQEFDGVVSWLNEIESDAPVLIVGNKIDVAEQPKLVLRVNLRKNLATDDLKNRKQLALMSAKTGEGIVDGFQWLLSELLKM